MEKTSSKLETLRADRKRELARQRLVAKAAAPRLHPLSQGQRAVWFLHQLAPKSSAYNVMFAAEITSPLDLPALDRAIQKVVRRHSILSTTYRAQHGVPMQQANPQADADFQVVELAEVSDAELRSRLYQEADAPFDLENGPVLRLRLYQRPSGHPVLLLAIHHIAIDFWSLGVVVEELREEYAAEHLGQTPVSRAVLQFVDFVHWQSEMLASAEGARLQAYWERQLDGDLPLLQIPAARLRPQVQTYKGAMQDFPLNHDLAQSVRSAARAEGVTPYMVFVAAFASLLYRYTGQTDLLIGSPVIGRSRPEFERVVGYFSNPAVLRLHVDGECTFRSLLTEVRDTVLAAIDHQDYPFPLLVERLQPARDASYSPLFQVMFMWDKAIQPRESRDTGGPVNLELKTIAAQQRGSALDLALTIFETGANFSARLQFNTDIFDTDAITRMGRNFTVLLDALLTAPGDPIAHAPLLTKEEREQSLVNWNHTAADYPRDRCVHELFERQVRETPSKTALVFEGEALTFAELDRLANRLAHRLHALGLAPEALVAICLDRSAVLVIALLGVLKAGAAYVPLDPAYPKERLALMVKDARPAVLLTQTHLLDCLPSGAGTVTCVTLESLRSGGEPDSNSERLSRPHNLAYVIYTSGSTGQPRGVAIPHSALMNLLTSMQREPGLSSRDVFLAVTSLSFDIAALEIFLPLISGATLVVANAETAADGTRLLSRMIETGATVMQATPATWRMILDAERDAGWPADLQLRKILCGGEALSRDLARRLLERVPLLYNVYGPTETTIWSAVTQIASDGPITIGHPIANTQICLLDAALQPVPIGVPAELHIGGEGLARGYHGCPDLTKERFIQNPLAEIPSERLYKTGDLARFRPDGRIEFLGRLDRQVKVNGHRIELGEVESSMRLHAGLKDVAVAAREGAAGDSVLVAYVVSRPADGGPPSIRELREFLSETLPQYMLPSVFVFLDELPLTANRKIDYKSLPVHGNARPDLDQAYAAPRNRVEATLAAICAEVLEVKTVGIHDNFFDLGGTSLRAVQIVAKASDADIPLVPEMLFENQTVAELAAALEPSEMAPLPRP